VISLRCSAVRRARGRSRRAGRVVEATDHWVLGRGHVRCAEQLDSRVRAATSRARLDRGAQCGDRVSLGGGRGDRTAEIAAEFVRLKVDVIVTGGTALVAAAMREGSTIPIVFASAGDPVGTGLVASLAHPGGNVTGLSIQSTELAGKRLELLREVVPGLRRLAIMANVPPLFLSDCANSALD
jgi:ABC transporter substrate binding protein